MSDERERVVESVERLLIDVLKLHESGCANRMAITGGIAEGMFVESAKAEHPVRVIIWKQWVILSEKFKPNNVKDLSALRRVVSREIRDRFLAQCQETMDKAQDPKALLEWKLVGSNSDTDDSILIKSRITGIFVSILVAGIITEVGCAKGRSFVVKLPHEREAILNEFRVQAKNIDCFLMGGHALAQDHQRLREVFEQNIDAILAPLQWYDIATKWFSNRDHRAVDCREAVWDRIMAGKESDECDLESVPADEFVCAIIEEQFSLNPRTRKSDLIESVFARLIEIASIMRQPLSWISPPEPMIIQALTDKKKRPQHWKHCLEYIRGIESPGFVNKWKQKQPNRLRAAKSRKNKGEKKEKDSMPERAKLRRPVIVLASNGRRASLMNDFCDWLGLWQALTHDYRVSSSSSAKKGKKKVRFILPLVEMDKECMARYNKAVDGSQLLRDKQEYNRVSPQRVSVPSDSPHFSHPPVPPSSGNFLFPPHAMSVAPPPPPPPMGWMHPSTGSIADSPAYYHGQGAPAFPSLVSSSSYSTLSFSQNSSYFS